MKIVIVGGGDIGYELAKQLIIENKDVIIIEQDHHVAESISHSLDCQVVVGQGNNPEDLKNADIENAEFFISVTGSDEVNIISCGLVSRDFNITYRIARVENLDYFATKVINKSLLGIDYVVNPEIEAAKKIIETIKSGASSDIMQFDQSGIQMRNLVIEHGSFLHNMKVKDAAESMKLDFLIVGVEKSDSFSIPSGESVIEEEDTLYFFAKKDTLEEIFKLSGRPPLKIKNMIIAGGSKIAVHVAEHFMGKSINKKMLVNQVIDYVFGKKAPVRKLKNLKIIDNDYSRCKELAELFPEAVVINSDISEENVFLEEDLNSFDLILTATDNSELNILAALYGKTSGIARAISLVNRKNYMNMASKLGIDAVVNPKGSITNPILKFIRKGNIKSIHSISGGDAEVFELLLDEKNNLCGKTISELDFPSQSLVMSVIRDRSPIIPHGNLKIEKGDHLIVIAHKESLSKIEKLLAG